MKIIDLSQRALIGTLLISALVGTEGISSEKAQNISDARRFVAEQLLLDEQAKTFARGQVCNCDVQLFIKHIPSPYDPLRVAYPALNLLTNQAAAYAKGQAQALSEETDLRRSQAAGVVAE